MQLIVRRSIIGDQRAASAYWFQILRLVLRKVQTTSLDSLMYINAENTTEKPTNPRFHMTA